MLSRIVSPLRLASRVRPFAAVSGRSLATQADDLPEFTVGPENGFLPRREPLEELPEKFKTVESLLNRMPVSLENGQAGLLAFGALGPAVDKELEDIPLSVIDQADQRLLAALYRDYTFLASAYLLEPCDLSFKATGSYGLGRPVLPAKIARPLARVAERLDAKPFMEYALSYALYNYKRADKSKGLEYDNLRLIRKLHGGPSEAGFILVHVAMVAHTGKQVYHAERVLKGAEKKDRNEFYAALRDYHATLTTINEVMDTMWARSDPKDYLKLRTFIMGIKDQSMFPNGVIYEGVDDKPRFYRGESGANDSIIPTCDNLLQLPFPENPLTEILKDFRSYRPKSHNDFLAMVLKRSTAAGVRDFALQDVNTSIWYLANIDRVREFRMRHWNFTKEYIIRRSSHPTATGGSPITTWLPNQLGSVLRQMEDVDAQIAQYIAQGQKIDAGNRELYLSIKARYEAQLRVLTREVEELSKKYGQQIPDTFLGKPSKLTSVIA